MNLFNTFDPMTSFWNSLNWLMILFSYLFIYNNYWMILNRWNMLMNFIMMIINSELNIIMKKKIYKINFISVFMMFMILNLMGLFSYIFSSSSHMSMNLSLALPFWSMFMILGWMFNNNNMLIHQVPIGTPPILMPFMVLIEFISNIIRPGTLSIRLTANMIAGHLLLTLMSSMANKLMILFMILLIITQMLLMILELSVSIIQAYVFMTLLSLYSQEIEI